MRVGSEIRRGEDDKQEMRKRKSPDTPDEQIVKKGSRFIRFLKRLMKNIENKYDYEDKSVEQVWEFKRG